MLTQSERTTSEAGVRRGTGPSDLATCPKVASLLNSPREWNPDRGGELAESYLPDIFLPGFGTMYGDCGDDRLHFCRDCGSPVTVGRTCRRSTCPRCGRAWVFERTKSAVGKLDATARMMSAEQGEPMLLHHCVLSPPDSLTFEAEDPLDRAFDLIGDFLKVIGAEGLGSFHPFRGINGDDMGAWKDRLFQGRSWEDVRGELTLSPHFHLIIVAPWIPGGEWTKKIYEETGWVFKRIADEETGISIDTRNNNLTDLAAKTAYVLSHTGIDTDGETNQAQYRYFGSTLHKATVYDDLQERADHAVREIAPRVIGLPSKDVACQGEVSPDERSEASADTSRFLAELDGDGNGSGSASTSTTTVDPDPDQIELVSCGGGLAPIKEAPHYLESAKWREKARYWEELRDAYDAWDPPD